DAEKPESAVNLSSSSSVQSGRQDDMTKKKDKGKGPIEYFTGNKDFNTNFKDYSEDSSNNVSAAGPIVKQKEDGIFISQDKYVAEILKKFWLTEGKSASAPIDTKKPLLKDPDGKDVDVHIYRSMIGSLMYLTSSRSDIMFAFWNTIVVKQSNDVTRLQALVDKKKVMVTEATIRDALHLDDAEGVDCLHNEEIFTALARMGYEKPSTKLTFYKAFFLSQWKFLIHTILQSMSAKRTSWNEFSLAMASAVICLSTGRKFNLSKYIFESLVRNGDAEEQGNDDNAAEEPFTAVDDEALDACATLARRVEHLEHDKEETKEVRDNADDAQVEGRQADIYHIDMDHAAKVLSMQEDESEVQEAVEAVTTAKLITKVVVAVSETVSAAAVVPAAVREIRYQVMKKRPQTEAQARRNMMMEEEESRAIAIINETPAQKAAKKRRLNKEAEDVEELKQHLEIMPDEDDDVYTEATPLARKVPIVDYQILHVNNKPRYKIIKADGTHQLYASFITMLKKFDRDDLETLWSIVKESFRVDAAMEIKEKHQMFTASSEDISAARKS
nr:hypothetical protein [Tanacetum cinerariifolium]